MHNIWWGYKVNICAKCIYGGFSLFLSNVFGPILLRNHDSLFFCDLSLSVIVDRIQILDFGIINSL